MRFNLVDHITEIDPGRRLRAVKRLTLGEEYLADHFPTFPVMPGVLMLQTLVEAASWLLRLSEEFRHSIIVLRQAKNVKYGSFMEPGRCLEVTVELAQDDGRLALFKGRGANEAGSQTVSAQFSLARYNLAEGNPAWAERDRQLVTALRQRADLLRGELRPGLFSGGPKATAEGDSHR
jgi:3-hydroxyacyl-[acyl-carrier-protein] dehydratase